MSDGGPDIGAMQSSGAFGPSGGAGVPNGPQPGTCNPALQLAAAIFRTNFSSVPNTGFLGIQDSAGLMAKQFSILGPLPTGPCSALAASLKKHIVAKDTMGDYTAGITHSPLDHAPVSEATLGAASHGLDGGGGMSHVAALSRGSGETEIG